MIRLTDHIAYIPAVEEPLSADIGIIRTDEGVWLFDVGSGVQEIPAEEGGYRVVLSHFHPDHTGGLAKAACQALYVSRETQRHVRQGTLVEAPLRIGGIHIFPLPSSHAKGCLGLETGEYAFVGDALYGRTKNGRYGYNATLLKDEIHVLKGLHAEYLLSSHDMGHPRRRTEVIAELEAIYALRDGNSPEVYVSRDSE